MRGRCTFCVGSQRDGSCAVQEVRIRAGRTGRRRFPDEKDLGEGFTPGVRFFFRYDELDDCRDIWEWSEKVYEYVKTL